jgi:hypothetical protein
MLSFLESKYKDETTVCENKYETVNKVHSQFDYRKKHRQKSRIKKRAHFLQLQKTRKNIPPPLQKQIGTT